MSHVLGAIAILELATYLVVGAFLRATLDSVEWPTGPLLKLTAGITAFASVIMGLVIWAVMLLVP